MKQPKAATKRTKAKAKAKKRKKTVEELNAAAFTKRTGRIFQNQRRDAREAGVWLDYDASGFRRLVARALESEECPYCQGRLTVTNFSADHKVPKSRGGGHSIVNLVICCSHCNQAKGALDHVEWRMLMNAMTSWHPAVRQHTIARLRAGGMRVRSAPKTPGPPRPQDALCRTPVAPSPPKDDQAAAGETPW